jgi:electron transport complex protein RnfC
MLMWGLAVGEAFAHGVHPPGLKEQTASLAIEQFPFAPLLVVPLVQHIGQPAEAVVAVGQEVVRGAVIAKPGGPLSVPMHAPASGVVRALGLVPSLSGRMVPAVYLQPHPGSTQEVLGGSGCELDRAEPADIVTAIRQAGLVGLGGAAFPTYAKLQVPAGRSVDTLLINGAECEPYLTTDHRVMLEQADEVVRGVAYLLKASGAGAALIAVEANKQDAAERLRQALAGRNERRVKVVVLPVKYPQGAEKMLIKALLGREVPARAFPVDVGVLCFNVASTAEIGYLLPRGEGLQERVLTVGGPGIARPGNYRVPIGTPVRFLLETLGTTDHISVVFSGGPMMGQALSSLDIPVTKGTTGIIALGVQQTGQLDAQREFPCIRCGSCLDACPMFLNPAQLGVLAKRQQFDVMAAEHHLMDCFECGCCTYVCPAHIPLVHHFRVAKQAVRRAAAGGEV